jgi:hypothetical protein
MSPGAVTSLGHLCTPSLFIVTFTFLTLVLSYQARLRPLVTCAPPLCSSH